MFLLSALAYGYNWFIGLLMENDKKYTDKDVIIRMTIYGIILLLCFKCVLYTLYSICFNIDKELKRRIML